jgi:hypothetical protein
VARYSAGSLSSTAVHSPRRWKPPGSAAGPRWVPWSRLRRRSIPTSSLTSTTAPNALAIWRHGPSGSGDCPTSVRT